MGDSKWEAWEVGTHAVDVLDILRLLAAFVPPSWTSRLVVDQSILALALRYQPVSCEDGRSKSA